MLLYCVYIKKRIEAVSLALGFLLKLWLASVFSVITVSVGMVGISLKMILLLMDLCKFNKKLLTFVDWNVMHTAVIDGVCLMEKSTTHLLSKELFFSHQLKPQSQIALRWDSMHCCNNNFNDQNSFVCLYSPSWAYLFGLSLFGYTTKPSSYSKHIHTIIRKI